VTTTFLGAALVARTREIDPPGDVLDELAPDGFAWLDDEAAIVTSGVAARVAVPDVATALTGIDVDDPLALPGTGALAVGALPFHGAAAGELVIPARVTGVDSIGRAWRTEIGVPAARSTPEAPTATRFSVESAVDRAMWHSQVDTLLDAIAHRRLDKAVLAREVVVSADVPFDTRTVISRLRRTQGGCFMFAADGLVGATPELLVRRRGDTVVSRPMAGTITRGATAHADAEAEATLAASVKDGWEHRLVVDAVADGLRAAGVEITGVGGPQVARLATVSHLATTITGRLGRDEPVRSALELACALHPTPAVGGEPRDVALTMLHRLEPFDRRRYAGPVGWVDAHGDGAWGVALRCAELDGRQARLVAGAGIVAGSDPDAEWAETQVKLEPMLQALVAP
jgi:menaquinone-specific isochorismate synthase